jgi:hypothetical protein
VRLLGGQRDRQFERRRDRLAAQFRVVRRTEYLFRAVAPETPIGEHCPKARRERRDIRTFDGQLQPRRAGLLERRAAHAQVEGRCPRVGDESGHGQREQRGPKRAGRGASVRRHQHLRSWCYWGAMLVLFSIRRGARVR